jgi:hypothetical protein
LLAFPHQALDLGDHLPPFIDLEVTSLYQRFL